MNKTNVLRSLLVVFFFLFATHALAQDADLVVQTQTRIPKSNPAPLQQGVMAEIESDWGSNLQPMVHAPDHTYKTIWVRMFPLLTTPLSDPFGQTEDLNNFRMEHAKGFDVYSLRTQKLLVTATTLHFNFAKTTFTAGKKEITLEPVWVVTKSYDPALAYWDHLEKHADGSPAEVKIKLRGNFVVQPTTYSVDPVSGKPLAEQLLWSVTNVVDLDKYLQSVVPSEAIHTWEDSALQAQAIAARTYGLYQVAISRQAGRKWDLDPTTWYQSYRGVEFYSSKTKIWSSLEQASTTKAIQATTGEVITYKGDIIQAYFSANSGGVTCTVAECFGLADLPYFLQVNDAPGIVDVAGGTWGSSANLTPKAIKDVLEANGVNPPADVKKITPLVVGPSGRTWQLRVELTDGQHMDLDMSQTKKVMKLFGGIRSYLYDLGPMKNGKQSVEGHGYGHGVGLSQWGAQLYAKDGWSAHKIVKHFYPNTDIKSLKDGKLQ